MFLRAGKRRYVLIAVTCFLVLSFVYIRSIIIVPNEITLLEDDEVAYNLKKPLLMDAIVDKEGIIKIYNDNGGIKSNNFKLFSPVVLIPQKNGSVSLDLKLLGLISLKTLKVDVIPPREIAACGSTVGVKLKTDGILVIGISGVEAMDGRRVVPTMETGIKPGDLLMEANGKKLTSVDELIEEINKSNGNGILLKYKSGNELKQAYIKPEKAIDDKKYHIGLWVRDSSAGIGTLTFYDPVTKYFGALGHGITDIDTGTLMPIESGEILESSILGIRKGKNGIPGELKGVFVEDKNKLGVINLNCHSGIYGKLNEDAVGRIYSRIYQIGLRTQVKEGPAIILSNIDGKKVEEYEIEIQKINSYSSQGTKGMVIKITDRKLLDATGGIIQGMSGSPIIQNDRIIGAVTHVLVNDPSRGYGIFIETMLNSLAQNMDMPLEKAS